MDNASSTARRIFDAGVQAADPVAAVTRHLDDVPAPALIIAVGKAAGGMAQAATARFHDVPVLVVTNYENARPLEGAKVYAAGHPVPDDNGAAAAKAVIAALQGAGGPVLALISGGGSALLPAPAGALTLADKIAVNTLLLGAGLDIRDMNLIRQQLSDIKGGGFLWHAAPHKVTALILSDVVGDDLAAIASGPTVGPIGTAAQAVALLQGAGIWARVPAAVRDHLAQDRPADTLPEARNILIGSNRQSVVAMAQAAGDGRVIPDPVTGDVGAAAKLICDQAGEGITLWGGETTVVLQGTGRGGRNQELALRIALEARARGWRDWVCLQGGTDGRDGPTDAAGGIVDQDTLARIDDVTGLLANNDSYAALAQANALLMTGATGTNVADLGVLIRRGGGHAD
ncbi:glycerate kinase type-2 family protein [Yoonia sp.]|uniref:glycerate kinase type-2 family protein n=1 Tax=Yoonia sp. TaxID=2212373 RepID=UPI003A4D834C